MTKYEHYIKETRGGHLRPEDLRIILMLNRNIDYPSVNEIAESEELIKEKDINLNILGISFLRGDDSKGVRYYNVYIKQITKCLSIDQWKMLKKYYSSIFEKRGN